MHLCPPTMSRTNVCLLLVGLLALASTVAAKKHGICNSDWHSFKVKHNKVDNSIAEKTLEKALAYWMPRSGINRMACGLKSKKIQMVCCQHCGKKDRRDPAWVMLFSTPSDAVFDIRMEATIECGAKKFINKKTVHIRAFHVGANGKATKYAIRDI